MDYKSEHSSSPQQQTNLVGGSTGPGQNHEILPQQQQQQQFQSGSTNLYAASASGVASHSGAATTHWQRVACVAAATTNGIYTPQNQQQSQTSQLRYFQLPKQLPSSNQYATQLAGIPHQQLQQLQQLQQQQQQQQQYGQHYAILAACTSNSSVVSERLNPQKREAAQHTYFVTPFAQKCATLVQTLILRSYDDGQLHQVPLGPSQDSNQQTEYHILTNGQVGNSGLFSLTTCFALTASIESLCTATGATLIAPGWAQIIPSFQQSTLPLVNAFEAVPDMLRDVRAGLTSISLTRNLTPLLCCTQAEFSYHAHKFQLPSTFGYKDRSNENRCPVPVQLQQPLVLKDIQLIKENPAEAVDISVNSRSIELGLSLEWQKTPSSGQKTYADVVQETGKSIDPGKPCGNIEQRARNISSKTMKAQEGGVAGFNNPDIHEELVTADYRRISEGVEYFEDETEDIRNFVIRAHNNYQNPVQRLQTSNSSTPSTFSEDSHISGCSDGNRLCRMAEKFCFEELENAAFFRAFDEYNRYRRRMAYTRRFLSSVEDSRSSELTVFTAFSLDNCDVDCSWMFDGEDGECSSIERSELAGTDSDSSVDIALKKGRGAFKVLKNFRECTSSTKSLYTNSWRPGEIYLLRRRHSMKNV